MAAQIKTVIDLDQSAVDVPALFWYADEDMVVVSAHSKAVAKNWGGLVHIVAPDLTPEDDPSAHVLAGDIMSPGQTDFVAQGILDWIKGL